MTKGNILSGVAGVIVGLLLFAILGGEESIDLGGIYSQVEKSFKDGIVTDCIEMSVGGTSYTLELQSAASTTGAAGDRFVPSYKAGTCN